VPNNEMGKWVRKTCQWILATRLGAAGAGAAFAGPVFVSLASPMNWIYRPFGGVCQIETSAGRQASTRGEGRT